MKRLISIACLGIWLAACTGPEASRAEVEALMQATLDEKISTYRERLAEDCQERILKEAAALADSIIVLEARIRRDTAQKPAIPPRPQRPETRRPVDSLPVAPLIPKADTGSGSATRQDTSSSNNR